MTNPTEKLKFVYRTVKYIVVKRRICWLPLICGISYAVKPVLKTTCIKRPPALTLYHTIPTFVIEAFENIVGKGENAGNQHFLLFPQCFLPFLKQISIL